MKYILWLIAALTFATLATTSNAQSPTTGAGATVISSNKVAAAFAKGMPLLKNRGFNVHASRRDVSAIDWSRFARHY